MSYYRTCQICGASLDAGEQCDCMEITNILKARYENLTYETDNGQMEMELLNGTDRESLVTRTA